ncbi:MAG: TetR family transcriptional regulator [Rhizobiaceae bacterium]|nr:TetR family transcriptional regulator [Rhizobiaceae bacterium]
MSLRETKKERTRQQMLEAALMLIAEKGFEQTTIDEIAEVVQVSSRTFFRYFPTKEDVVVAWVDDEFSMIAEKLAQWPSEATPFTAATGAMRTFLVDYEACGEFFLRIERVISGSPTISARKAARTSLLVTELSCSLAQRMGLNADRDLLPDLIAGAVTAAARAAIRAWLAHDGKAGLVGLYDAAIDRLTIRDGQCPSGMNGAQTPTR